MEFWQALVLGMLQGVTEFLPISSTAHLLIFTQVMGWQELGDKTFVNAIQLGSVFAVIWYFWPDLGQLGRGGWAAWQGRDWQREEWKILVGIAVGTLPALGVGFLFRNVLPKSAVVIAIASILLSMLLAAAEVWGKRKRNFGNLTIQDGLLVGLGQMLALIPGVSRSGATLTTALFLGLERDAAARFSFLLGIPTLAIATGYESYKVFQDLDTFAPLIVGIISSFIFSYLAIAWLLGFLRHQNTWIFVWYRLAFGGAILGAITAGQLIS
ncbi:MAG: undecaprenyl-diphosphate phosphatase [Pseudanabaenaceae cyanobacterium bins.68]|nr:undecaprenyl-diphosphate phosphatase [Pseudanabaenaceae cyanobacterium bins.68]